MKTFSVIIAHLNDEVELYFTLYNYFKELDGMDYEIIVVDNGSSDYSWGTIENYIAKLSTFHPIKLYKYTDYKGTVPPWQYGTLQATGKYLVFSDSHILNSTGFFHEQLKLLEDETIKTLYASACFNGWGVDMTTGYGFSKEPFIVHNLLKQHDYPYDCLISQMGCVITDREHFINRGMFGLNCFNQYGGFGAEEIMLALKTWMWDGRCVINPNVYYLHTSLQKDQNGKKQPAYNKLIGAYVLGGEAYMRSVLSCNPIIREQFVTDGGLEEFMQRVPEIAKEDREFIKLAKVPFNELVV